jgi:hypothetical protein
MTRYYSHNQTGDHEEGVTEHMEEDGSGLELVQHGTRFCKGLERGSGVNEKCNSPNTRKTTPANAMKAVETRMSDNTENNAINLVSPHTRSAGFSSPP